MIDFMSINLMSIDLMPIDACDPGAASALSPKTLETMQCWN